MRLFFVVLIAVFVAACSTRSARDVVSDEQASRDFETGRRVYALHCARCHGVDGKAEGYALIKRLDGIGGRLSREEILEATWASGFVARDQLDADEARGLAAYVASL